MNWIDSHCHLEYFHRKHMLAEILQAAEDAGVRQMITVGTTPADWDLYHQLATEHSGRIYWTAGLHPCEVGEDWQDHLSHLLYCWTKSPPPLAVGETGLDYFHLPKDTEAAARVKIWQCDAFRQQLDIALQVDVPVVVHSRNAFADSLQIVLESGIDPAQVVFHCFSEGPDAMRALNDAGCRGSFTGIVSYKNAEAVRQSLVLQQPDITMIETDAPYLAPDPHRGKRCEPAMVSLTGHHCARILNMEVESFAALAYQNTKSFFRMD